MTNVSLRTHHYSATGALDPAGNSAYVETTGCGLLFMSEGFKARAQIEDPEARPDQLQQDAAYTPLFF